MMSDDAMLSSVIGDIYDAALDPALWPDVLDKTCRFVGSSAGGLTWRDVINKTGNVNIAIGVDPQYQKSYVDSYVKIDPTSTPFFFFDVGEIFQTSDMLPYDEFIETRFFKEWARPQGWIDAASALLEKTSTSYAAVTIFRHEREGLVDDSMRHRMQLLVPHIRRAVLISKVIDLRKAEAATLADTFDSLAAALFLVDAVGRIVQANTSGHALVADGSVLRAAGGRLVSNDPNVDRALREAFAAAQKGDTELGTQGIAVPLTAGDGQRYVAHVLSLTSGARRKAGVGYAAAAAVFVRKAELDAPSAPEAIAKLYGLTPSELRVLLAVFEASGGAEIAAALGISQPTVRTHLRRLFEKTGTSRQADLVKLVGGFSKSL